MKSPHSLRKTLRFSALLNPASPTDHPSEIPLAEIAFHPVYDLLVAGVSVEGPIPDRDSLFGDREIYRYDRKLGMIALALSPFEQSQETLIHLTCEEGGVGGIEKDPVQSQLSLFRNGSEYGMLDLFISIDKKIHRPVEIVYIDTLEPRNKSLVFYSMGDGQFGTETDDTGCDHGEDHPRDGISELPILNQRGDSTAR